MTLFEKMNGKVAEKMVKNNDMQYFLSTDKTLDLVYHKDVNTSYSIHTHAEHDILGIVLDGFVLIETQTDKYVCEKHNLFMIPMDTSHAISSPTDSTYTMITICIHRDYTAERTILEITQEIENRLIDLLEETKIVKEYSQLLGDGLTLLAESRLQSWTKESYLQDLKSGLLEVPEVPATIEEMSEKVCVSPFHMIRRFKKEIGLTPHQFQIQCRIRKAQRLLLEKKTITEVALETGFCDQSHFDKSFKKVVGMSPVAYLETAHFTECKNALNKEQG